MIISIDSEIVFHKIRHPLKTKALKKEGTGGKYLKIIKDIYDKSIANIIQRGRN
jgi:hypothetical protein